MGSTGTVLVLLGVGAIIFLLVMFGFINIPFLNRGEPDQWRIDISAASEGGTVTNIQALASVNPRGIIFVDANEPLQVNASDFAGWSFSYWLFDNATYGETPYVVVPAQEPNSTHTLVAVFEPKIPVFQIPIKLTTTKGITSNIWLNLVFTENNPIQLYNIHLKLNDPYGVFSSVKVLKHWSNGAYYTFCLNAFSYDDVFFEGENIGERHHNLISNTENPLLTQYTTSSNIPAGTYNLTWEIQFTVASGSFSEPPELIIPWQVTILG